MQPAELETKRILLEIFKERQRKSAEAGSIPSFYKKVINLVYFLGYMSFLFFYAMIKLAAYLEYDFGCARCLHQR
jgi:hypothetical protein